MSSPSQASPFAATVAICTYNGAGRINVVFQALVAQTSPCERWELLVIDNASTDGTSELAERVIKEGFCGRGRVVCEGKPGISFARARAAREAVGEIICFLDDDNIPAPDFVATAIRTFAERPKAGVIGGKVIPRWETQPTPLAEVVAPFALAICDLGGTEKRVDILGERIVGAGLCVRTELLKSVYENGEAAAMVSGRKGKSLMSGEDLVISVVASQLGWECWYNPKLTIEHVLPATRMDKEYLLRLYEGIGRGQSATRKVYDWKARTPLSWLIALKDFARWQLGQWRGASPDLCRHQSSVARDLHDLQQRLTLGRARQALSWPN